MTTVTLLGVEYPYGDIDGKPAEFIPGHGEWAHLYFEYHKVFGRNSPLSTKDLNKLITPSPRSNIVIIGFALKKMIVAVGSSSTRE